MTNIIIIHGTGGNPKGNWFPWLKSELEKAGHKVFVPKFPTPKNQSLNSWESVFEKYEKYLDKDSIVIGHSLGPAFLLSVLERSQKQIKAAFFVAGFTGLLGISEFDGLNKTFACRSFDWTKIKDHCRKFYVINSDNDPYVPLQKGRDIAKNLGTKLIVLKNAGHINADSGYLKAEFLLRLIESEL